MAESEMKQQTTNWQQTKRNWNKRVFHLFKNEEMSDIAFTVTGKRIVAHKLVLASASPVFHAMFYGAIPDCNSEIEIKDCDAYEKFESFIEYIYTEKIRFTWANVFQLCYLSIKYMVSSLARKCYDWAKSSLRADNALSALKEAVGLALEDMANVCYQFIRTEIREIANTDNFLCIDVSILELILKMDALDINEIDLVLEVNKWCVHKLEAEGKQPTPEEKQNLLGGLCKLIHFPELDLQQLGKHGLVSGLLSNEEFVKISWWKSLDLGSEKIDSMANLDYPFVQRKKSEISVTFDEAKGFTSSSGKSLSPTFSVNRKAWLTGASMYCSRELNELHVMLNGHGKSVEIGHVICASSNPYLDGTHYVMFKSPPLLIPELEYSVAVVYRGPQPRWHVIAKATTYKCGEFVCKSQFQRSDFQSICIPQLLFSEFEKPCVTVDYEPQLKIANPDSSEIRSVIRMKSSNKSSGL